MLQKCKGNVHLQIISTQHTGLCDVQAVLSFWIEEMEDFQFAFVIAQHFNRHNTRACCAELSSTLEAAIEVPSTKKRKSQIKRSIVQRWAQIDYQSNFISN